MGELISTSPNMELQNEDDSRHVALNTNYSEEDATEPTAPTATETATATSMTVSTTTASPATETAKRQLTPFSFSFPSESSGSSSKRPRLDLAGREARRDPEALSPTTITSSLQHPSSSHASRDVNETVGTSTWPSVAREYGPPWVMEPPHNPRQRDVPPFYQPPSPSPLSSQPGDDFQNLAAAGFEAQSHQSQLSKCQNLSSSPSGVVEIPVSFKGRKFKAVTSLVVRIDGQKREISSSTGTTIHSLIMSKPAQAKDLEHFPCNERYLTTAYLQTDQGKSDADFVQWYSEIRRPYWAQMMVSSGKPIPGSLYNLVWDELCISHPCITDPWTAHIIYRSLLVPSDFRKHLIRLKDWMYGSGTTTHATWRETLSTKTGSDRKVPWVKREKIIALSVILACAAASGNPCTARAIQSKFEILENCKLTYLLSNQDHVLANGYWDGFAEELDEDPEQEHLYDKVMQAKQSAPSTSSLTLPSFPVDGQEASGLEEPNHEPQPGLFQQGGHSGQAMSRGVGGSQMIGNVGANIHEHSGGHTSFIPAQQSVHLADAAGQDTQNMTNDTAWLQGRVWQLEAEVTELRGCIEWIHQRYPGLFGSAVMRVTPAMHQP